MWWPSLPCRFPFSLPSVNFHLTRRRPVFWHRCPTGQYSPLQHSSAHSPCRIRLRQWTTSEARSEGSGMLAESAALCLVTRHGRGSPHSLNCCRALFSGMATSQCLINTNFLSPFSRSQGGLDCSQGTHNNSLARVSRAPVAVNSNQIKLDSFSREYPHTARDNLNDGTSFGHLANCKLESRWLEPTQRYYHQMPNPQMFIGREMP